MLHTRGQRNGRRRSPQSFAHGWPARHDGFAHNRPSGARLGPSRARAFSATVVYTAVAPDQGVFHHAHALATASPPKLVGVEAGAVEPSQFVTRRSPCGHSPAHQVCTAASDARTKRAPASATLIGRRHVHGFQEPAIHDAFDTTRPSARSATISGGARIRRVQTRIASSKTVSTTPINTIVRTPSMRSFQTI